MNLDNLDLRRRPDSNRGIAVLQTAALPLGYAALFKYVVYKTVTHLDEEFTSVDF